MKKIPTIFVRDYNNMSRVLRYPNPVCTWVFEGEGVATRKYDGLCCIVKEGRLYKRRVVKKGYSVPNGFLREDYDTKTGKTFGWMPVTEEKDDRWHREAFHGVPLYGSDIFDDGTYELCGPKIQGNPEGFSRHVLVPHPRYSTAKPDFIPIDRTYDDILRELSLYDVEGLVFHHQDGRMAKIKKRDFGLSRKPNNQAA